MADARSGATPLEGNGKRILMVYGTPKAISLCHALGEAYAQAARSEGHVVRELKLGELDSTPFCTMATIKPRHLNRTCSTPSARFTGPSIWYSSIRSGGAACRRY